MASEPNVRAEVGSTVTLRFADGTEQALHIGESANADDATLITHDSPLGSALLGRSAGDTVRYRTPAGQTTAEVLSLGDAS
ncbi:GreA/GreB family elongation factor [Streptomyces sp. NPDC050264]|uniref:GreA/GreB family elongation factor n=1 Tax=Streptomyces sp. NPDC050264 TaxID=3155038 RepID=UPI003426DF04